MGLLGSILGGIGSGIGNIMGNVPKPMNLQGLAGKMPQPQGNGILSSLLSGGGVPGSLRPSNVGMPGYQAETAKYLAGQQASGGPGIGGFADRIPQAAIPAPINNQLGTNGTQDSGLGSVLSDKLPGQQPDQANAYKMGAFPKIDNIRTMISDQVQKLGSKIAPGYFDKMAQIESGYNPTAVSPTGAKGLFQFTGGTWKQFGDGNPLNPVDNTSAAIKLANSNYDSLQNSLGRAPSMGELYMAHNIGAGGAKRLLGADPNMPVTQALIGSNPAFNPKFLRGDNGSTITARQAIQNYNNAFAGTFNE